MEILPTFVLEVFHNGLGSVLAACTFSFSSEFTKNGVKLFSGEEVWDPTR
jgi:hypothetical protein